MNSAPSHGEYIIEITAMGNSVKATAIDPHSMTEATIIGPASATQQQLSELAVRKLLYILGKREES